jgi:hypothetical protein
MVMVREQNQSGIAASASPASQDASRVQEHSERSHERGALMIELLVAVALLLAGLLPIAYGIASEKKLARASYQRAIAMEIVDGELEALAAGGMAGLTNGTWQYTVHAGAAVNLPPGNFFLTVNSNRVRLEWRPGLKDNGGTVFREARFQ